MVAADHETGESCRNHSLADHSADGAPASKKDQDHQTRYCRGDDGLTDCNAIARRARSTGRRTTNRAPVAGSVHMSPPRLRSVCRAKAKPSPSPSGLPHVTNGSNKRSRTWSGIPGPVSSTVINTPSTLFCAQMFILAPCGIASIAFSMTLKTTRSTGERYKCNKMPSGTPNRTWTRPGFFVASAESEAAMMTSRRSHTPTTAGSPCTTLIRSDTSPCIRTAASLIFPARLIGASGSGKSTFGRRHFQPTEVLSSDFFAAS